MGIKQRRIIQSVKRCFDILELIAKSGNKGFTLKEISESVGLNKNTAFQLISTLLVLGYIEQEYSTKRYFLGYQAVKISNADNYYNEFIQRLKPILKELMLETQETAHIAIIRNNKVLFLDKEECDRNFRVQTDISEHVPIHCTAVGKAIIAFMEEERRNDLIENMMDFKKVTDKTIINKEVFKKILIEIRQNGFSIDDEESFEGVRCIAAPIFNIRGRVIASIGISAPSVRINDFERFGAVIKRYGEKCSGILCCGEGKNDFS